MQEHILPSENDKCAYFLALHDAIYVLTDKYYFSLHDSVRGSLV